MATLRAGFQYTSLTRGGDIRRQPGIVINDILNSSPNTAQIRIDGASNIPLIGEKIEITDPQDGDRLLFAGNVQSIGDSYEGETDHLHFDTFLTDFTFLMNRRRPIGTFNAVSASEVVRQLISQFAPDFTTNFVQSNLAKVTVILDGTKTLSEVFTEIAHAIGGGHWYVDYVMDVHFFHIAPDADLPPSEFEDLGANITLAEGADIPSATTFARGYYFVRHTFVYDDGTETTLKAISNVVDLSGTKLVSLTGIPIGPSVGPLTCVARRLYFNKFTPGGIDVIEPIERHQKYCEVSDNTTTSLTTFNFSAEGGSVATVIPITDDQLLPNRPSINHPQGPLATITPETFQIKDLFPPGINGFWFTQFVEFKCAFLYRNGTVSFVGPPSSTTGNSQLIKGNGILGYTLRSIPIGSTINNNDVVARFIYWAHGRIADPGLSVSGPYTIGFVWPSPLLPPDWGGGVSSSLFALIPDNTTESLSQVNGVALGTTLVAPSPPATNVYDGFTSRGVGRGNIPYNGGTLLSQDPIPVWPNSDGPYLEGDDPPDDLDDNNTSLLRDSPFRITTDMSQVRNRVIVLGAGSTTLEDATAGDLKLNVQEITSFSPSGGQVRIHDLATGEFNVIDYDGVEGVVSETFITLLNALPFDVSQGSIVTNFFQADDVESQEFLAQSVFDKDGNPTDGVYEFTIVDSALKATFQLYMRAFAELELFSRPVVTVEYATRDPKTKSGQLVQCDLTTPPCVGEFLIQEVVIDQIHDESEELLPRYTARASSIKFELNDLLLSILAGTFTQSTGSSGITSTAIAAGVAPDLLFLDLVITDAQLKAGGPFTLIDGEAGKLIIIISFFAYLKIVLGGGQNMTVSSVRYSAAGTNIISSFTLFTGVAANNTFRFTRNAMAAINVQTSANLIGDDITMVTSGTAHADFVSDGGYHTIIQYLKVTA